MPIKYVPFIPEPVEGQAVLGNFNRILRYKGADDVSMTIQRGMPLYEMEKKETVGENSDGNMVIRGECVSACAYLKEQRSSGMVTSAAQRNLSALKFVIFVGMKLFGRCN